MTEFEWILVRWMNPEPATESEVSHKDKYHVFAHIFMEARKMWLWTYLGGRSRDANIEDTLVDTAGTGEGGEIERLALKHTRCHM